MSGTAPAPAELTLHGTAIVLGGRGILITGASGSGKSLLALDLLEHASGRNQTAALIADDGVLVTAGGGSIAMRAPAAIAGLIEVRGRGVVPYAHMDGAGLDLWVELVDHLERMPEAAEFSGALCGITVARCPVPRRGASDPVHQRLLVLTALRLLE